jgi:hypothetical protein
MALVFTARRAGSDFELFCAPSRVPFGKLVDCELCYVFQSDDDRLDDAIAHRLEGDMSLRELLAEVRAGYVAYDAYLAAEAEAERQTELRVEQYYENRGSDEALFQREMEDRMGVVQFEDAMDHALGRVRRD